MTWNIETQTTGPHPPGFSFSRFGWDLRIFISNTFSDDVDAAGLVGHTWRTTFLKVPATLLLL